jgi:hypothetical protein
MEECPNNGDHTIYKRNNEWEYVKINISWYPDTVLFTEKVADKICGELNDPELNFLNI